MGDWVRKGINGEEGKKGRGGKLRGKRKRREGKATTLLGPEGRPLHCTLQLWGNGCGQVHANLAYPDYL